MIDPGELASILRALGWIIKLQAAVKVAEHIGAHMDKFGQLSLSEKQFVDAINCGQLAIELDQLNIKSNSRKLKDSDRLLKWILQCKAISDALSGAIQLLLLAHTPVSRKVFLYFHCQEMSGRSLLRADYDISCQSGEYFGFMPFVVVVLVCFTIALPSVISFYLFNHRKELYTTKVHARIGWLCKFVLVLLVVAFFVFLFTHLCLCVFLFSCR